MGDKVRGLRYLLVCVDAYTWWPESVPTKSEDSKTVIKLLITSCIPWHGFPEKIRSDNRKHFKNNDLQKVDEVLGLKHKFGTNLYHPQSQGKVERMNANLKNKLAKMCAQTKMNRVDALPLALMAIRSAINNSTDFTPHDLQTGRSFPGPHSKLPLWWRMKISTWHIKYIFTSCKVWCMLIPNRWKDARTRLQIPTFMRPSGFCWESSKGSGLSRGGPAHTASQRKQLMVSDSKERGTSGTAGLNVLQLRPLKLPWKSSSKK